MKHRKHHVKNKVQHLKTQKPIFKRAIFWIVILFLIVIFSFLYFFIFSSKFQVSSVIVSGNNNIHSDVLQNITWNNVNKKFITLGNWNLISKSIFLTGPKIITEDILKNFPEIESVKVSKKFPQTITLTVEERSPFAIFCQTYDTKCFYIDKNGIIFTTLDQIPQNVSIIRQAKENEKFEKTGDRVIEKNIMDIISKIKRDLKDNFQVDIKSAMVTTPFRLNIETSENWQIYFNLESETDLQITKMNALLKDEIPAISRATLQYIDLRFKDRAYYK
jgi:cell division septal protein FtsQ